ncbi:hypothetical protein Msip34_2060 [Methylovorus glucosotrophus SIP3-4]|uniref:Uncharacterized protein n=1 Tax=Methylovorus glucosotrophus (strain SIP3-4) TaxID=582744 RepID=C6X7X5_METGS|nr:hypothetical protein Msip34_2060 [Methylovorus glucosotrophus SIP3-4]
MNFKDMLEEQFKYLNKLYGQRILKMYEDIKYT